MKVIKLIIFFTFLISNNVKAQKTDTINNEMEKNSISTNIFGCSPLVGITYERYLSRKFIYEIGIGILGVGTGITFYPFDIKNSEFCFYTGAKFSAVSLLMVGGAYGGYIPFGVTFFSKYRFNIGLDIGPALGKWERGGRPDPEADPNINYDNSKNINVYGNLKISYRF